MAVLAYAEVGQEEGDEPGDHQPQVAVGAAARDLTYHAHKRDIRALAEHVVGILRHETLEPRLILAYDIGRRGDDHRRDEHHRCPEGTRGEESPLVAREEEEGEPHDAVELDECAKHDEESCPEVALLTDEVIAAHDNGGDGNVELLHLDGIKQLVGAEPEDDHLLPAREEIVAHGDVEGEREGYEPQEHAQPHRRQGEGGDDQREERPVVVHVEVLGGVVLVEGLLAYDVPVDVLEDEEIILSPMSQACHARDGDEHPEP